VVRTDLEPSYRLTVTDTQSSSFVEPTRGNHVLGGYTGSRHTESHSTRTEHEVNQTRTVDATLQSNGAEDLAYLLSNAITGRYAEVVSARSQRSTSHRMESNQGLLLVSDGHSTETVLLGTAFGNDWWGTETDFTVVQEDSDSTTKQTITPLGLAEPVRAETTQTSHALTSSAGTTNAYTGTVTEATLSFGTTRTTAEQFNQTLSTREVTDSNWAEGTVAARNTVTGDYGEGTTEFEGYTLGVLDEGNQRYTLDGAGAGWTLSVTHASGNAIGGGYRSTELRLGSAQRQTTATTEALPAQDPPVVLTVRTTENSISGEVVTETGNEVRGDYDRHGTAVTHTDEAVAKSNQTLAVTATLTSNAGTAEHQAGNRYTGRYDRDGSATTDGTRSEDIANQTLHVHADETTHTTVTTRPGSGGNDVTGAEHTLTGTRQTMTVDETDTNPPQTVVRHSETTSTDTATEDSNAITGAYTVVTDTDHTTDSRQTTTNLPLVVVETAHEHRTGTETETGNAIRGNAHAEGSSHTDLNRTSDQANQALRVLVHEAGSEDEVLHQDSNAVLGDSTVSSHTDGQATRDETVTHSVGAVAVRSHGPTDVLSHTAPRRPTSWPAAPPRCGPMRRPRPRRPARATPTRRCT
jgi:hypothetical protein